MQHDKFSMAEMFSDTATGKTSIGKVCGFVLIVFGVVTFSTSLIITKDVSILNIVSMWSGTTTLLGSGLVLGKIIKPVQKLHE
jgi:hypothetical protein